MTRLSDSTLIEVHVFRTCYATYSNKKLEYTMFCTTELKCYISIYYHFY